MPTGNYRRHARSGECIRRKAIPKGAPASASSHMGWTEDRNLRMDVRLFDVERGVKGATVYPLDP